MAPYGKFQRFFSQLIQEGIEEGTLEPIDPASGAQVIISLASGLLLQGLLDPEAADWGRVSEDSIQIMLKGLMQRRL